jgi:hypothetical protein
MSDEKPAMVLRDAAGAIIATGAAAVQGRRPRARVTGSGSSPWLTAHSDPTQPAPDPRLLAEHAALPWSRPTRKGRL